MTLAGLVAALVRQELAPHVSDAGALDRPVTGLAYDSRKVRRGDVFVALVGQHTDGTRFAADAVERGAHAVVSESRAPAGTAVPWVQVHDARLALAVTAAEIYRHPSHELAVVGITGTNGKTTTAYVMASIFDEAGSTCGLIGTVAYRVGREEREASRTTPEASDLQALLREMVDNGCGACAMEVSSHALSLKRADEIRFAAGIFTNLTRDHLDFHGDMEAYFRAKRRLFELLPPTAPGIVNLDDPKGLALAETVRRPVTYAVNRAADVTPGPLSFSLDGLAFDIRTPRGLVTCRSRLVGRPNVYNILAAVAAAVALDLPFSAIEQGVRALAGVPGRFEVVSSPADEVTAVVDYAHTDDALRNLLDTARPLAAGRLITVFGCGGDRDRTKRPLMGAVARRLSDLVIVTSDNPRTEDPSRIIEEIQTGLLPPSERPGHAEPPARRDARGQAAPGHLAIVDRRAAIERAIELAQPGDMVLIAGKGHEKYQAIGERVVPFDDAAVAREALSRRRSRSRVC
jgi:UDP-N-acetylmuramoyl-L-alanyl-D-glutamate--2,6-diaminopimelate ligase